MPQYKDPE